MAQDLKYLKESASQTAGPYVHIGLTPNFSGIGMYGGADFGTSMLGPKAKGERISVSGTIIDGTGAPIKDGLIEVWQADAAGLYNSPVETRGKADADFAGWGRFPTDMASGLFSFETIKPGAVPFPDGRMQAPHITIWVVARGINLGLNTRLYFADEAKANEKDPVLTRLEHQHRIKTLIATRDENRYRFDIVLQGADETIFFDI